LATVACSGAEFSAGRDEPCSGAGCGAASSGGARPDDGAGGGVSGNSTRGGMGGVGMLVGGAGGVFGGGAGNISGGAGMTSIGGVASTGFPATGILDDFNRTGPGLGLSWVGASQDYALREEQLAYETCYAATLWATPFGEEQEAFATLARFDEGAGEINVVLKAQGSSSCELIEVLYSPLELQTRIAYCYDGAFHDLQRTSLVLRPGDTFGGRAHADGTVEVFANGTVVATYDVSAFPYRTGRIGVNGISGPSGLYWDDFGGGDVK